MAQTCCFFFSLKVGCLISAAAYTFVIICRILLIVYDVFSVLQDEIQALFILKLFILSTCAVLLIIGALKEERVFIITFVIFNLCQIGSELFGFLVIGFGLVLNIPIWCLVYLISEYMMYSYLTAIGVFYAKELKENDLERLEHFSPSLPLPTGASVDRRLRGV